MDAPQVVTKICQKYLNNNLIELIRDYWVYDKSSLKYELYLLYKERKGQLIRSINRIRLRRRIENPNTYLNTPKYHHSYHISINYGEDHKQFMICTYCNNYLGNYIYGHNNPVPRLRMLCDCELTDN